MHCLVVEANATFSKKGGEKVNLFTCLLVFFDHNLRIGDIPVLPGKKVNTLKGTV
jgi:hypothetical protein